MKTFIKTFLVTLSGILYLATAYSIEPHSSNMGENAAMSETAANNEMGKSSQSGNSKMGEQKTGMSGSGMGNSEMASPSNEKSSMSGSQSQEAEMAGFSRGTVARSVFTTLIDNREPVDKIKNVPEQTNDVFYFTELRDMEGQTAKHRWEYKGKVVAEVKFSVRGPRWRVWSKKSFTPGWSGDWKVSVVNGADEIISEEIIAFNEPTHDIVENDNMKKSADDKSGVQQSNMPPSQPMTN